MFEQRRCETDPERRKQLTREIWTRLKTERAERKEQKLDKMLSAAQGAGELAKILSAPHRRKRISAMNDSNDNKKTDPADIAEVFGKFYEEL